MKKTPEPFRVRFEHTMGIHFFTLVNIGQNASKKNLNNNFIVLYDKKCFQNQFWTLGSVPIRKHMKVKLHIFWLGHFAMSKIEFASSFPIKYYIITILKYFLSLSTYIKESKKMDFPLYFQILRGRVQGFFLKLGS